MMKQYHRNILLILNNSLFVLYFKTTQILILGVCFILYFLKLLDTNGFWSNLRTTDVNVRGAAELYPKGLQEYMRAKHDFLQNCKTNNVFLKFVRWKNIEHKALDECIKYYTRNLNDANKRLKELTGILSGLRQFLATESPLKMMKNAFYFISKALFVLKIFKFLS